MSALLASKVAVIYGGGGAIGGAAARVFAREGARVLPRRSHASKLATVARDIESAGGYAEVAALDVFDESAVNAHADSVASKAGGIDIMLNAIGIAHVQGKPFSETSLAEFEQPITPTARAQFIAAQAVARHMVNRNRGVMLTLTTPGGSIAGKGSWPTACSPRPPRHFHDCSPRSSAAMGSASFACGPTPFPMRSRSRIRARYSRGSRSVVGIPVHEMLAEHGRKATLLGRLPHLAEVAEFAAFAASDRAGAMTGAIANLTCGSMVD